MSTQPERSSAHSYKMAPLRMEFTVGQLTHDLLEVVVQTYSGTHKLMRRSVVVGPDSFGSIPLCVENDLYQWVAWLCSFEQARRTDKPGQLIFRHRKAPQWPAQRLIDTHAAED